MSPVIKDISTLSNMWRLSIAATLCGDQTIFGCLSNTKVTPATQLLNVYNSISTTLKTPEHGEIDKIRKIFSRDSNGIHAIDSYWLWTTALPLIALVNYSSVSLKDTNYLQPYMGAVQKYAKRLTVSHEVYLLKPHAIVEFTEAHFQTISKLPRGAYEFFWNAVVNNEIRPKGYSKSSILQSLYMLLPPAFAKLFT